MPQIPMAKTALPVEVLRITHEAISKGLDVCVATVVRRTGSAPSSPGQKLVLCSDGTAAGTVGGGGVEKAAIETMQQVLGTRQGDPALHTFHLANDLAMACGGTVEVLVEPMWSRTAALLVGAGHVGLSLAKILVSLGFAVTLCDERPESLDPMRLAELVPVRVLLGNASVCANEVNRSAAVVVATHEHKLDEEAVMWAMKAGFAYVGGVGSRGKAQRIRAALQAAGFTQQAALRMRMPIGVEIGARSPEEIAVSIAAELVSWKAKGCAADGLG